MNTLRTLGLVAIVPLILVAGGCSAGGASQPAAGSAAQVDGRAADGTVEDASAPQAKPGEGGGFAGTLQVKVARNASAAITVADVEIAATRLRAIAAAAGGVVTTENLVTRVDAKGITTPTSTMVISVPADTLDSTLEQLKTLGTITSRVISSEDVTMQVADVASRVKALEGSIARLNELSRKAGTIAQLTQLESELTNRIEERDSMVAQQKALAGRVAQSPVTVTLQTPPPAVVEPETPGFLAGLTAGWNALVNSSRVLLTVVGAVLPFLILVAAIGVPVVLWRRRGHRVPVTGEPAKTSAPTPPEADE
jgi:DNA-binding transcriptional regulator YdaS (Cro superfamily)